MLRRAGRLLFAIYSPFFMVLFAINTWVVGTLVTVVTFFSNRPRFVYRVGGFWSRLNLALTGVSVEVHGAEHIQPDTPYVVMANHQSLYDVWAIIGYLPMQLRWVIKYELRHFPVFGTACHRMGHIFIQRGVGEKARLSLERAATRIRGGASVFFFPEGTRSMDGRLIKFKQGGFHVAQAAGVDILPLTVNGGIKVQRKDSLRLLPGHMDIVIHPPIPVPTADSREARQALMADVRQVIESGLRLE